jgi:hypothetical protein
MLVATVLVFLVYQIAIAAILSVGVGGPPTYVRVHPVAENAARILRLTPAWRDTAALISREPIVEYGRLHRTFGVAVWSFELTWASLGFFLSFSALLGVYLGLGGPPRRWSALGPLGGAGIVGLLGASVSSLTHCGLGSFGVLLAIAGVSTATITWFGRLEPVMIPLGYALMLGAIGRQTLWPSRARPAPSSTI